MGDEITVRGYRAQVVWDPLLTRLEGMVLGVAWYWIEMIFGVALRRCVIYSNPFVDHTLW
jgi:hypothetical protein